MKGDWMKLDWGNVPAWVGSVLTGSSLLIASLTYRRSIRNRREEELNREREPAAKVSAWVSAEKVYVKNANDAAVKAQVFFENASSELTRAYDEISIGPEQQLSSSDLKGYPTDYLDRPVTPALIIVDASGVTWLRHANGKLDRIKEQDKVELEKRMYPHIIPAMWRPDPD